jgi:hypothetical protein
MLAIPPQPHLTQPAPFVAIAIPTIAPTMLCVVETGSPSREAKISQMAAAERALSIPAMRSPSAPTKHSGSAIPPAIVLATRLPRETAPKNSHIPATIIAFLSVRAPLPTEVPNCGWSGVCGYKRQRSRDTVEKMIRTVFATSLAPVAKP